MFKIYYADLGKATGIEEIGRRPVVSVGFVENKVKVYKITSRQKRDDKNHIKLNNYIVSGYCEINRYYLIDKKYLLNYKRDCTATEIELIKKKAKK